MDNFIPATIEQFKQAANGEIVLWVSIRPHTATLRHYPWVTSPRQGSIKRNHAQRVPIDCGTARDLELFEQAELKIYLIDDPLETPLKNNLLIRTIYEIKR